MCPAGQPYDIQFPYDSDSNEVVQLEDLCDTDPGQLVLMDVARSFMANYSCAGKNSAGWGPRSEEKEFLVHCKWRRVAGGGTGDRWVGGGRDAGLMLLEPVGWSVRS